MGFSKCFLFTYPSALKLQRFSVHTGLHLNYMVIHFKGLSFSYIHPSLLISTHFHTPFTLPPPPLTVKVFGIPFSYTLRLYKIYFYSTRNRFINLRPDGLSLPFLILIVFLHNCPNFLNNTTSVDLNSVVPPRLTLLWRLYVTRVMSYITLLPPSCANKNHSFLVLRMNDICPLELVCLPLLLSLVVKNRNDRNSVNCIQ